jgi:GDP-L-fucose synthase
MKKVLLTGGSGFIGRNVIERLGSLCDISAPTHKELELADAGAVRAYLRWKKFDVVVHAAIKPGHRNAKDLNGLLDADLRQFMNIADNDASWDRMIVLGSGLVYNHKHYRPMMAESFCGEFPPEDEAGFAKYVMARHGAKFGGRILDLRPFGVYGRYEDYAIRFISNAICKTLFSLPVTINRNRKFSYVHVNDLVDVISHFIENAPAHDAYNVTPDAPAELSDIAKLVVKISGASVPLEIKNPGMGIEYSGSNKLLKSAMPQFKPLPLEDGIKELFGWYAGRKNLLDKSILLEDK